MLCLGFLVGFVAAVFWNRTQPPDLCQFCIQMKIQHFKSLTYIAIVHGIYNIAH